MAEDVVTNQKEAPVTIRMMNRINATVVLDKNPVIQEVEKLANVKLVIDAPPITTTLTSFRS